MRILFVTQLTHLGGVDTFVSGLLHGWNSENLSDQLIFRMNAKHPGLAIHRDDLGKLSDVEGLNFNLYTDDVISSGKLVLGAPKRIWLRIYRGINARRGFHTLFRELAPERLVWIAGGYPGGDSLLTAFSVWNQLALGPPPILNVHNLAVPVKGMRGWLSGEIDRRISKETGLIVAVSRACADSFRQRPHIWQRTPITFVYNGVKPVPGPHNKDAVRRSVRLHLGLSERAPLCLMLATYEPRKGHAFLLEAFSRVVKFCPDAHLLICGYGDAEDLARVGAWRDQFGLTDNVTICGYRDDRDALLVAADLLVVPSQAFESFGLVCAEAFSAGLPVVATNIGGLSEVVEDGVGGYSVDAEDVGGFAGRISDLLTNPQLRTAQGALGKARYETMFSLEKMVNFYTAIVRADAPAQTAHQIGNGLINR